MQEDIQSGKRQRKVLEVGDYVAISGTAWGSAWDDKKNI